MSYESAPATALLATHCACCGRPLVDAVSVEAGVGPDCRRKYGYGEAQGVADWARAGQLLGTWRPEALAAAWGHDAHASANVLVHAIASGQDVAVSSQIAAVDALGFKTLAAKLLAHRDGVVVEDDGAGMLRVRAPFSEGWNEAVRRVPGQRWIGAERYRAVPARSRGALWAAIKSAFAPGTLVSGPKGIVVL